MKTKIIFIAILFIITTVSCSDEYDLETSVLIYDSEYSDLPEYSEWGYNTFGAYYDRKVFISNSYEIPLKVISTNNSTTFIFKGELRGSDYSSYYHEEMSLKLELHNFQPSVYSDLLILNDTIIDLEKPDYSISIIIDNDTYEPTIIGGEFNFKKAQNLIVDNEPIEVILSGVFDFQMFINEEPISISNGRFDVGIGESNFYNY